MQINRYMISIYEDQCNVVLLHARGSYAVNLALSSEETMKLSVSRYFFPTLKQMPIHVQQQNGKMSE